MIRKGDLVKNKQGEVGIVVTICTREKCIVLWGNGLHQEGPVVDLQPVLFSPETGVTASFVEMVCRCYGYGMTWLREGPALVNSGVMDEQT